MRANCHPFVYQNWSFAHNGQIGGFKKMQRPLERFLSDDLYQARQGSTDADFFTFASIRSFKVGRCLLWQGHWFT